MSNKNVSSNKKNTANGYNNVKKKNIAKKDSSRIGFLLFIVVMFLVILVSTVFGDLQQIIYNKEQTKVLSSKYTGLLEEEASLNSEVNKLQDADYIERYAREKYMYTLDGEKILIIIDDEKNKQKEE
jgi:cell division protein DivIC